MRTRNSFYNMLTNLIPSLIIPVLSLVKLKWLLSVFGNDIYGMNLYLTQILGYLNLVEGGFGEAFVQALFKPLAENDKEKIKELYRGADFILKGAGLVVLVLGGFVLIALPWMLKTELSFDFVRIVFVLMVVPTAVDYFLMAPSFVIQADQHEYYLNIIRKTLQILRALTHLAILYLRLNYLFIPLAEALYIFLQIGLSRWVVFRRYPFLREKAKRDLSTLKTTKDVFAHRLAGTVLSSTDTLLLGAFIGTSANTLYGNYVYVTGEIQKILTSIVNAPKASVGNMFATKDEKSYSIFKELFVFTAFIATIVCIPTCVTINDFVGYWQNPTVVLTLFDAFLFSGILYFVLTRQPIMIVRDTNGLFKESKKYAFMEAGLNFGFSIIGVYFFGITGALVVTFLTYLASDLLMNSRLVYRTVFQNSISDYYQMYLSKFVIAMAVGGLSLFLWKSGFEVMITSLFTWFIGAGILFIVEGLVVFGIYMICFKDFRSFVNRAMGIVRRKLGKEEGNKD